MNYCQFPCDVSENKMCGPMQEQLGCYFSYKDVKLCKMQNS